MTISETIQKAQQGGYMPEYHLNLYPGGFVEVAVLEDETPGMPDKFLSDILIDPLFWQSLGKAMGWKCLCHNHHIVRNYCRWRTKWHQFIDHLAEGKDISSFFENL